MMNDRQKKILKARLSNENEVIAKIKQSYEKALQDIDLKISELLSRTDVQNIQSIIYQVDYQRALKGQINAFLAILQSNNFETISAYLTECYKEGWISTLYDLQGQGIPLLFPIDQEQVITAIQLNTKLSKKLYTALQVDIDYLKKVIRSEISRGISQGQSYREIARNVRNQGHISRYNAIRIAQTEGHRITNEATFNCQVKAQSKGAQITKQWDATLDAKTRPSHQELDGQLVEVDKPFIVNGYSAMYPGDFGVPSEDIHCRCAMLQRAKWALTDEEFTKYNGESRELQHFENIADYNEFKKEFWKWEGSFE